MTCQSETSLFFLCSINVKFGIACFVLLNSGFVLVDKLSGVHAFLFIMTNLYIEQFKQISVFLHVSRQDTRFETQLVEYIFFLEGASRRNLPG